MISFGTAEFFEHLRDELNRDGKFRKLGKGVYTARELIYIRDLKIGVWQETRDGFIEEFRLVPTTELKKKEEEAEIMYYVDGYDTLVKMLRGDESFVSMVIDGTLEFRGSMRKAMQIQGASDRMEILVRKIVNESVIPSKISFEKWAKREGYI